MSDIYMYIAEMVYQWEYAIIFVIGIVISLLLWCFDWKILNKQSQIVLCVVILLGSATLSSFIAYVKKGYDYLPEVNYNTYSYASVEQMLLNKGFKISDLVFDALAEEKLEQGEEPASYYFKVTHMEPLQGTFVDKDTKVILFVTWLNYYDNTSINPDGDFPDVGIPDSNPKDVVLENFNAMDFYGNVDARYVYAYNSNEVSLYVSEEAMKMYINDEVSISSLGFYPESDVKVEAQLVNYETNETICKKTAKVGDVIIFADIPDGIYYYILQAEGYEMYVPDSLFRLEYDITEEQEALSWGAELKKIGCSYSEPIKILIYDEQGILRNTEAHIRVVDEEDLSPDFYSAYPVTSNEDGYLTVWRYRDGEVYYALTEFSVQVGCRLEVCLGDSDEYVPVELNAGTGICRLSK